MVHENRAELCAAFLAEWSRWTARSVTNPTATDPKSTDPALVGDLVITRDTKYHPDNSGVNKWKCRVVPRGDLWTSYFSVETCASSLDSKAPLTLLSHAASQDLDL